VPTRIDTKKDGDSRVETVRGWGGDLWWEKDRAVGIAGRIGGRQMERRWTAYAAAFAVEGEDGVPLGRGASEWRERKSERDTESWWSIEGSISIPTDLGVGPWQPELRIRTSTAQSIAEQLFSHEILSSYMSKQ